MDGEASLSCCELAKLIEHRSFAPMMVLTFSPLNPDGLTLSV